MWDKPDADWQEDRIYATIRKYQPEAMIINNTGLNALGKAGHKEIDSVTFERGRPGVVAAGEKPIAGEVCDAMTDHWGYAEENICFKSVPALLDLLIDCRKYGHNLLLNARLKGNGKLTEIEKYTLLCMGKWIHRNGDFIYDCKPTGVQADNADIVTDGKYYYAIVKGVPMGLDQNVTRLEGGKAVKVHTDGKVKNAVWLDNGKSVYMQEENAWLVEPFPYGRSLSIRVARFEIEK